MPCLLSNGIRALGRTKSAGVAWDQAGSQDDGSAGGVRRQHRPRAQRPAVALWLAGGLASRSSGLAARMPTCACTRCAARALPCCTAARRAPRSRSSAGARGATTQRRCGRRARCRFSALRGPPLSEGCCAERGGVRATLQGPAGGSRCEQCGDEFRGGCRISGGLCGLAAAR